MSLLDRLRYSWYGLPAAVRSLVFLESGIYLLVLLLRALGFSDTLLSLTAFSPAEFLSLKLWTPLTYLWVHFPQDLFGMLFDMIILWSLGGLFARRWRASHFVFFYVAAAVLGALFDLLLYLVLPGKFSAACAGTSASSFALFTAFYLVFGDAPVSVLGSPPMRGRTVYYLIVGLELVLFLAGTNPFFGIQLGGILAGWLLVTGRWRPRKLQAWFETVSSRFRWRRSGFRVVN